jgi:hypothetical protein
MLHRQCAEVRLQLLDRQHSDDGGGDDGVARSQASATSTGFAPSCRHSPS